VKKNTSQLAQNMRSSSDQLSALTTQLKALQRESNEQINLLQKQVGKNKRQWLIAEAEYLTRLANTRLRLVGDVDTAIIALQAADQRLKENGDPSTFTVREQLAKEIHALNSVTLPDIVGISSQLLALESALSHLPISDPHAGRAQAAEIGKGEPSPMPENIQQTLNDAWQNFSKLIVVRRHDKPLAAMMTPEQVELIRKNLALKLEAARLALIRGDEALYTASIDISIQWLSAYFDNDQPSVKSALDQLNRLKNTAITVSLPTIDTSLKLLRDIPLMAISEQAPISPKTVDTAIDVKE
jgi:uroporphyrin-3 C-methyltransferase